MLWCNKLSLGVRQAIQSLSLFSTGSTSPVENVVKKLGILGSSPYQLSPQGGILSSLPGLTQQQQQLNGISHALNAGVTFFCVYSLITNKGLSWGNRARY